MKVNEDVTEERRIQKLLFNTQIVFQHLLVYKIFHFFKLIIIMIVERKIPQQQHIVWIERKSVQSQNTASCGVKVTINWCLIPYKHKF